MTRQLPDTFLYKRNRYSITGWFLKPYFEQYPERQPKNKQLCTALWRGYRALFHLRKGQLYVKDLLAFSVEDDNLSFVSVLEKAMPGSKRLFWLTGLFAPDDWRLPRDVPADETIEAFAFRQGRFEGHFQLSRGEYERVKAQYDRVREADGPVRWEST